MRTKELKSVQANDIKNMEIITSLKQELALVQNEPYEQREDLKSSLEELQNMRSENGKNIESNL